MLFSSSPSFLSAYFWPTLCSNDYKYRWICLRGRGRVSKKVQDMQVMWLWSCSNFPPSSPPNPIFGRINSFVLKNSIQKSFHSEEVPKREDLRRMRRCSTGHVHSVQLSHPILSPSPHLVHLSLATTMCSRASCNPAAQSPIHAPGRRNKRNANSSTIPNSPSSFCKASRRQNATHIPQFTFSIHPSSYAARPATYTKSPIQGKCTTWTIDKTPSLDNIWPHPTPSWPQHQNDQCHRDRLWIWLALSIWIIGQY